MLGQKQRECGEESGRETLGGSVYVLSQAAGFPSLRDRMPGDLRQN